MKTASTVAATCQGLSFSSLYQWLLEFYPPTTTIESASYPVLRCGLCFALYGRGLSGADHRRITAASRPFCAARSCHPRAGSGQHSQLPHHNGSGRHWSRIDCDDSVGDCLPALPVQLRSNLSAAPAEKDSYNAVRSKSGRASSPGDGSETVAAVHISVVWVYTVSFCQQGLHVSSADHPRDATWRFGFH